MVTTRIISCACRVGILSFCAERSYNSEVSARLWRNWQTHQLEGLALAIAWWFESTQPHQTRLPACSGSIDVNRPQVSLHKRQRDLSYKNPPFAQNAKGGATRKTKSRFFGQNQPFANSAKDGHPADAALKTAALRKNPSAQPGVAVPRGGTRKSPRAPPNCGGRPGLQRPIPVTNLDERGAI